jgi:hypothetical protein
MFSSNERKESFRTDRVSHIARLILAIVLILVASRRFHGSEVFSEELNYDQKEYDEFLRIKCHSEQQSRLSVALRCINLKLPDY